MIIVRILGFIGLILVTLFSPVYVFLPAALIYALIFPAYELVVLAIFVDALFGEVGRGFWATYTLLSLLIMFGTIQLRPYVRFYRDSV